jgi:hypothetical protein
MFTIVDRSGDEVRFRTDKGAWIKELYSGYNLCSYSDEIDAEIAKNNIENKERLSNLQVLKIKQVKMGEY